MKSLDKKIIMLILILPVLVVFYNLPNLVFKKDDVLPKVNLVDKMAKENTMAIMVSDDGSNYQEYESNEWPNSNYKFKEAKCVDNNGNKVEGILTFEEGNATIKTDKTVSCTLYFDYQQQ